MVPRERGCSSEKSPSVFKKSIALLLALVITFPAIATAAEYSQEQKNLVDQLMKALVKAKQVNQEPVEKSVAPLSTQSNREILETRAVLDEISREASRLIDALYDDHYKGKPGVNQFFPEVWALKSDLTVLIQRAQLVQSRNELLKEMQSLDKDWRVLAYKLQQSHDLNPVVLQSVQRINGYASRVNEEMNVTPQIDRREAQRLSDILAEQMRNLLAEIRYELGHTQEADALAIEAGKARGDALRLSNTIAMGGDRDEIIQAYKQFNVAWRSLSLRLRPFNNRYIEKDVMQVNKTDHDMHEVLHIPQGTDWHQLEELAHILNRDLNELFDGVTMKVLVQLRNPQEALRTGKDCFDNSARLKQAIEDQRELSELDVEFDRLDRSWRAFANDMIDLKGTQTWNDLKLINDNVVALRSALQVRPDYDHNNTIESAAKLESMSDHLQWKMRQWLNSSAGYNIPQRYEYLQDSESFVRQSRDFHKIATSGQSLEPLKPIATQLLTRWIRILGSIEKCQSAERDDLNSISQDITTELVKLQADLSLQTN